MMGFPTCDETGRDRENRGWDDEKWSVSARVLYSGALKLSWRDYVYIYDTNIPPTTISNRRVLTLENVITKNVKVLESPTLEGAIKVFNAFHVSRGAFVAVSLILNRFNSRGAQNIIKVYDSNKGVWESKHFPVSLKTTETNRAFHLSVCKSLSEECELVILYNFPSPILVHYNVFTGKWHEGHLLDSNGAKAWNRGSSSSHFSLARCGSRLILVELERTSSRNKWIRIFECDERSRKVVQLGHSEIVCYEMDKSEFFRFGSNDVSLFIGVPIFGSIYCFGLETGVWTTLRPKYTKRQKLRMQYGPISLGMNPFFDPASLPSCSGSSRPESRQTSELKWNDIHGLSSLSIWNFDM